MQLRLAAERDIPEILIAHQDDPSLFARLRLARPPSGAELGRRAELAETERILGAGLWLTVLVEGSDECAGQIDVHEPSRSTPAPSSICGLCRSGVAAGSGRRRWRWPPGGWSSRRRWPGCSC